MFSVFGRILIPIKTMERNKIQRNKNIYFGIILIISVVLIRVFNKQELVSPNASFSSETSLQQLVSKAMSESKGRYGIVIKNFKTGENFVFNEHQEFEPGSLYKLWVMAIVNQKVKEGALKEEDVLSEDIEALNDLFNIAPGDAEQTEGSIQLTVAQALNQMITISHNYAALLLTAKVGNSTITKFLHDNGFNESEIGEPPKTTPADIALFFDKVYKGELVDKEHSSKIMDLLKKQQLNDGLPKYLPQQKEIAHKTGDIGWFKHDGGIVYTTKGDYIIVVLSESDSPAGAQERISQLSKAVYEYFNK